MSENKDATEGIFLLSEADATRYVGQYVCTPDFSSQEVVAADGDPLKAYKLAEERGYKGPVMFYVPRLGETFVFDIGKYAE